MKDLGESCPRSGFAGPCVLTLGCAAQAEAAWRSRHKWAAQHLAHLLGDAHAKPPLAPVLDLVERVSVNIGLAVHGQGLGSGSNVWAWAAPTEGCSMQLGGSIIAHKPDLAVLEAATASRAVRLQCHKQSVRGIHLYHWQCFLAIEPSSWTWVLQSANPWQDSASLSGLSKGCVLCARHHGLPTCLTEHSLHRRMLHKARCRGL